MKIFFLSIFIVLCIGSLWLKNSEGEPKMKTEKVVIYDVLKNQKETVNTVYKTEEEWKQSLSREVFHVTREKGTEPPFTYDLLHNKEKGVYKCRLCKTDLFTSDHKFDSKTGWPSFWQPVADENIVEEIDNSLFSQRTEILCRRCGSHLGHVFNDGPKPTHLRYCINGVSLLFQKNSNIK